jgi:hypothetical protein
MTFSETAHALDPVLFAREELGFIPDPTQAALMMDLRARTLLNCTRQWGKSTTTAIIATHQLKYGCRGDLLMVVSPSARQSGELIRKIAEFTRRIRIEPRGDGDNEMSILYPNGSRVVGLPGQDGTIRGFSAVRLLIVDEAARVADATYRAVRPMLAVGGGKLLVMSTPHGKRGFFYKEWMHGGPRWRRIEVSATKCPRISAAFLEDERLSQGEWSFRQEYLCEFVDAEDQFFPSHLIFAALTKDVTPLYA